MDDLPLYIPLKTHSDYSLLQSTIKISDIVDHATKQGFPAIGICDNANLFGALEFSEACAKKNIQPIISINLPVNYGENTIPHNVHTDLKPHLTLTCLSQKGYENLLYLSSLFYDNLYEKKQAYIVLDDIFQYNEGLALLSGGCHGLVDTLLASKNTQNAHDLLQECKGCFSDRLYIELQKCDTKSHSSVFSALIDMADNLSLPTLAINESYFKTKADMRNHQMLLAIKLGITIEELDAYDFDESHRFLSSSEMKNVYKNHDYALQNTVELARRINFRPHGTKAQLPNFLKINKDDTADKVLEKEKNLLYEKAYQGLTEKLSRFGAAQGISRDTYFKQLDYETSVINSMQFAGYFLIVADFVTWAKNQSIPVGPGRGSGAGSLVAYSLDITTIDPLRFGLIFERFLNPDRISMPDFDIDFCQEHRDRIIEYVYEKYGNDCVGQIITFGKMQARAVLRDVGRAMGLPYSFVDRFCKLIPNNPTDPITLDKAIATQPRLIEAQRNNESAKELFNISQNLEGLHRHTSIHAAGIVIASQEIVKTVPTYKDSKTPFNITQFSMKWVEHAGLVKFDFLGLKTLSIIKKTQNLLAQEEIHIDIDTVELNDTQTFTLLSQAQTIGVFQLESTGMQDALMKLGIDRFEDLIALISLYRPGPMDNLPSFIARKNKKEDIEYIHPLTENSLKETYGIIVYQEQVMEIARILGGYSFSEADILRRAMGKKIKSEMALQKNKFIEGAKQHNIPKQQAENIFMLIEKFAGYGFNKSHAAAYALISYQTAYLKAHYYVHFMACLLDFDIHNSDKIYQYICDVRKQKKHILPPDINLSDCNFKPENGAVRYALGAIKNVSAQSCENIIAERNANGLFKDLSDFLARIDGRCINKKILENFIKSGVFDSFGHSRSCLLASQSTMLTYMASMSERKNSDQSELFISSNDDIPSQEKINLCPENDNEDTLLNLKNEYESFGFYLSGHPVQNYRKSVIKNVQNSQDLLEKLNVTKKSVINIIALITNIVERKSKNGKPYTFINLSDEFNELEAILFESEAEKYANILEKDTTYIVTLESTKQEEKYKHRISKLKLVDEFLKQKHLGEILQLRLQSYAPLLELQTILQHCHLKTKTEKATQISIILPITTLSCEAHIMLSEHYSLTLESINDINNISGIEIISTS